MRHLPLILVSGLALAGASAPAFALAQSEGEPTRPEGLAAEDEPALPEGLGAEDEPALPPGLEAEDEPNLPEGLEEEPGLPEGLDAESEPGLPEGLDHDASSAAAGGSEDALQADLELSDDEAWELEMDVSGFFELGAGSRVRDDALQKSLSMAESRARLEAELGYAWLRFVAGADLIYDPVLDVHDIDLERGEGFVDLREASLLLTPVELFDLKLGRQVLTWGTGDLVFINDQFPKDWNAFFIGRDMEYLKAPSDAARLGLFFGPVSLDLVYVPAFDADRFPDARRLSFFDPMLGRMSAETPAYRAPDRWFEDSEFAGRIHGRVGPIELAAYGYWGFWKSPKGIDPATGEAIHPPLSTWGLSVRGPIASGIFHLEGGWMDSRDDRAGTNPFVENSQLRGLVGYERELARNLTLGLQYYLEATLAHDALVAALPEGAPEPERFRHLLTTRLSLRLLQQTLTCSVFAFVAPVDGDVYLLPSVHYRVDDDWQLRLGANLFFGPEETMFGQFQRASNVFISARYSF